MTHTISYDEKPINQAAANKHTGHNPSVENGFVRMGTLSLLAGIDLLTGEAVPLVSNTHKSKETKRYLATLPEGRFIVST